MYEAKSQNPDNMVRCALVDSVNSKSPSAEFPVGDCLTRVVWLTQPILSYHSHRPHLGFTGEKMGIQEIIPLPH